MLQGLLGGREQAVYPWSGMNVPSATDRFARALEHQRVLDLAVQECWHQGRLSAPANVVFLRVAPERWLRFFFDAGVFFWRTIEAPDTPAAADGFEYRIVQAAPECVGRTVSTVVVTAPDRDTVVLTISFAEGGQLILQNRDDANTLRPAAHGPVR
jgi:hypothetical protein